MTFKSALMYFFVWLNVQWKKTTTGLRWLLIVSTWDMPLRTRMDIHQGPVGADKSSSTKSRGSCHRQLECSTGMTWGVSDPNLPPPILTPSSACVLINPPDCVNRSVETNGKEPQSREDAAGAAMSKATSHILCLSYHPHPSSPGYPLCGRGQQGSQSFAWLSAYGWLWSELGPNLDWVYLKASSPWCVSQPEVIAAQRVALIVMTRWCRYREVAQGTSASGAAITHSDVV